MTGGPDRKDGGFVPPEVVEAPKPIRIERILPGEFQPEVGNPADALRKAVPYFGEAIVTSQMDAISSGSVFGTVLEFEDQEDGSIRRIQIQSEGSPTGVRIKMTGAWKETELTPAGLPLKVPEKEKGLQLYRRINQNAAGPLIEVGQVLEPNAGIVIGMKGKRNRKVMRLPKKDFPKGGTVTAILVPDNKDGLHFEGGKPFAYVDPLK